VKKKTFQKCWSGAGPKFSFFASQTFFFQKLRIPTLLVAGRNPNFYFFSP